MYLVSPTCLCCLFISVMAQSLQVIQMNLSRYMKGQNLRFSNDTPKYKQFMTAEVMDADFTLTRQLDS